MNETITLNPMGETQRERWHCLVNLMCHLWYDLKPDSVAFYVKELHRYIDCAEDVLDELRKDTVFLVDMTLYDEKLVKWVAGLTDKERAAALSNAYDAYMEAMED